MANDIMAIDELKPINDIYAVCSMIRSGSYSKLLIKSNYPGDLTIQSIESKFDDRFDDPSYYYGGSGGGTDGGTDGGDIGGDGDVLGV